MTAMRRAALAAITLLVAAATSASFAESYRALLEWASRHGLHGVWAVAWPLQVDVFVAVGELALFVALADEWTVRQRAAAWTVTLLGLAVSVAGNVGHITGGGWTSRLTASIPPLAAAAALAVGLGVLKRVVARRATAPGESASQVRLPGAAGVRHPDALVTHSADAVVTHPADALANGSQRAIEGAPRTRGRRAPGRRTRRPLTDAQAELHFASDLASGEVPSMRRIQRELHVGQDRAQSIRQHLARQAFTDLAT